MALPFIRSSGRLAAHYRVSQMFGPHKAN